MQIELSKQRPWKLWSSIGLCLLLTGYAAYSLSNKETRSISESDLSFQTVNSGPLDIYSNVFGEFASARERLLTAPALGKVSEILIRPGTLVKPDTVILRLSNLKLVQELNKAQGQLAQEEAQREAFKYEQQSERLNYQGRIADIEAEIEKAQLELSVNVKLSVLGVVSKIELQRAKLKVKQETKRLGFEKEKYSQFLEMQSYQLMQRNISVRQQASQVALFKQQLDDMEVKAGITGSLQNLIVELGQSVQLGESLAKVGSNKELIALLRLPQNTADQIDINAPVIVNTQKGTILAHITRIESIVTRGNVIAEAVLDGELTSNARPSLAISAQVFIKHDDQSTYVQQVSGFRPRSKQSLFVKDNQNTLVRRDVTFGDLTDNKLLVTAGLSVGDVIVNNDTSEYSQFNRLSLGD
ncbi:MAG: HlyD family secretion protein [Granulosicoccus sp.]|jgi:HlyD family secretion protein